jgi:hypothetical protein
MKIVSLIIIMFFICSCTEKLTVTSLDQIHGKWKWESTCGGNPYGCTNSSKSSYGTIEFTSDNNYIEIRNDTIYMQLKYTIEKYDNTLGTLILGSFDFSRPITILNNRLLIDRGELQDTYTKIK